MRKSIKNILMLVFSVMMVASFALSMGIGAFADTSDVKLAFSDTADFVKSTETIENETVDAFGCTGWGGMVKVLTLDKPYDVSAMATNKNAAFSFDLYIGDQTTLENQQGATYWNIDICSDANYNDTNKYSFNLMSGTDVFGSCKIGWNRIVLFLSSANEKNSINWATVQTVRLNTSTSAGNNLKFANFKFTVTPIQEPNRFVLNVGENTLETVSLAANANSKFGDVNCTFTDFLSGTNWKGQQKQFDYYNGTSIEKKNCYFFKDIGSYYALISYNTPINASAYATGATLNNSSAALSFFIFFKTDACLETYRKNFQHIEFDISSGENNGDGTYKYSDVNKWSVKVSADAILANCRAGWNRIIVPLSTAYQKLPGMDWSNIRFIRYNMNGVVPTPENRAGLGDFSLCTSEYTEITVLDEEQNLFTDLPASKTSGPNTFNVVNLVRDGETVPTYIKPNTGAWWTVLNYSDAPIDATHFTAATKQFAQDLTQVKDTDMKDEYAAISFYLYFSDEHNLAAYQASSGFNIDVSSGEQQADGTYAYSDNYKYSFNFARLFEKCSVGWNRLILPFATHDVEAANAVMDWANIRFIRFNAHGYPGGKHPGTGKGYRLGIADIGVCFTSATEMTVEGWAPPVEEEEVVKNEKVYCDGGTGFHVLGFDAAFGDGQVIKDAGWYKEGEGALRLYGQGTGGTGTRFEKPINLSMYDKLSFWLYTDNAENFQAMADGQIELTSVGGKDDANEYSWSLKALNLQDGWNWVVLDIASAKVGNPDIAKINYFNIYFVGVPAIGETIIDDLHAHTGEGVAIETFDKGFMGQVLTVEGKVDQATNMSGQGWVARKKYAQSINIADSDTLAIWVYCNDADTAKNIAGTELEISSSGQADTNELAYNLPENLKVGWNYITWKISEGRVSGGEIDLTAVNFFGVVKPGIPAVTCYFDDFRAYDSRFTNVTPIEPIEKQIIISADKPVAGVFNAMTIDDVEYKEGFASLSLATTAASTKLKANFGPLVTGLAHKGEHELGYAFWFYVEDLSKLTSVYVELGSYDGQRFEFEWHLDLTALQSGWNWITLKASDGTRTSGVPDLNNLMRTRIVIDGEPTVVKFDCFVIVDSTIEGAFEPIEDKVELNPVDSVEVDNCESEWAYIDRVTETNETNKKQGYSSVAIANGPLATKAVNVGKTDLLYNPYRSNNQLGVSYWVYIEDVTKVTYTTLILMNEIEGANAITWTVNAENLINGWNWVVLGVEGAEFKGTFNTDSIKYVQFGIKATEDTVALIDRISVINYAVEANRAQPEYEGIDRNPVEDKVIIDCNTTSGTVFSGNNVDKSDFRYGTGSVYTSGYGYQLSATDLTIGKTDLTKKTFVLGFWVWVENVALFDVDSFSTQVEIGSTNKYDEYEINWENWTENLVNGWNWVVLYGKDANISGAAPDFDNLCRFRVYINGVDNSIFKIDRITISNIYDEDFANAPDWENEVVKNDGTFKGSNNYAPENSTYIEVDFGGLAEDFVAVEKIEGCISGIGAQMPLCFLLLASVVAIFKKKQK